MGTKLQGMDDVRAFCEKYALLTHGQKVLVGLSGGADSVYLTLVLQVLSGEWDLKLQLLHVNHQIRGEEADRDEAFCRRLAQERNLPIFVCTGNVPQMARQRGRSLEETAREYRYACMQEAAKREGVDRIAVAHHLDDQAETVLFQMVRGSGLRGLGGMSPQNGRIVRPLLTLRHAQIIEALMACGQKWCEDSTNQVCDYSRNRIRHEVLPLLEKACNPAASEHLARMAEQMQHVQAFMEEELNRRLPSLLEDTGLPGLRAKADEIQKLPAALQMEFSRWMLVRAAGGGRDITSRHAEALLALAAGQSGKRLDLPYGLWAGKDYGVLWICKRLPDSSMRAAKCRMEKRFREKSADPDDGGAHDICAQWEEARTEPLEVCLTQTDGSRLQLVLHREPFGKKQERNERNIPKNHCTKWFDYAKICGMLEFRHPASGDYLWLDSSGTHTKMLRRLFIDRHVPREAREKLWVLAQGSHIVWIPELDRGSAAYYVTSRTKEILCINTKAESEKNDERKSTCDVSAGAGGGENPGACGAN